METTLPFLRAFFKFCVFQSEKIVVTKDIEMSLSAFFYIKWK